MTTNLGLDRQTFIVCMRGGVKKAKKAEMFVSGGDREQDKDREKRKSDRKNERKKRGEKKEKDVFFEQKTKNKKT